MAEHIIQEFKIYRKNCNEVRQWGSILSTTPMTDGAVPNSFVFQQATQTRLLAQYIERDLAYAPQSVYMRVEHQKPSPAFVSAKVGTNTSFDSWGRLVHEVGITTTPKKCMWQKHWDTKTSNNKRKFLLPRQVPSSVEHLTCASLVHCLINSCLAVWPDRTF